MTALTHDDADRIRSVASFVSPAKIEMLNELAAKVDATVTEAECLRFDFPLSGKTSAHLTVSRSIDAEDLETLSLCWRAAERALLKHVRRRAPNPDSASVVLAVDSSRSTPEKDSDVISSSLKEGDSLCGRPLETQ